jgi:hypothetical protein
MTATITNHLGQSLTGEVRCWMGRRIVEVETPDGARHIGRLRPDPQPAPPAAGHTHFQFPARSPADDRLDVDARSDAEGMSR